jgi:hypothetical protein
VRGWEPPRWGAYSEEESPAAMLTGECGVDAVNTVTGIQKARPQAFWSLARNPHVSLILSALDPHIPLAPRPELAVRDEAQLLNWRKGIPGSSRAPGQEFNEVRTPGAALGRRVKPRLADAPRWRGTAHREAKL